MSRKALLILLLALLPLAVWGTLAVAGAPQEAPQLAAVASATGAPAARREGEITRTVDSPAISFIDNPDATCYRPTAGTGACYITWNYLNVTASSGQYIISMTVAIEDDLRAYHAGFFQTSMYIPGAMTGPGYKVTCGMPGSGGIESLGNSYSYTIRARETGGLTAANYGTVICPADVITVYLPLTRRP